MHGAARKRPLPVKMRAAGQSALIVASMMAVTSICHLVLEAEAGGKGKGHRQGHIIIQNELKGNAVPIYMPIPIPVPMPIVPPPSHAKSGHHHHHHQHNNNDDDSEGEVKKIYLLQPVQMARPQPNLKGGGYMGPPVQNHIHVGQMPALRHRHSPERHQQHHHHHHSSSSSNEHGSSSAQNTKSEVKILPIVVIPPVAPVPPIQVSPNSNQLSSHAPRMTLTPHFNNYVVTSSAGSRDRRRQPSSGRHPGSRGVTFTESFSEYGGSLGGSVFREQFAARARPNGRAGRGRAYQSFQGDDYASGPQQSSASRHPAHDFDYGDYDEPPISSRSSTGGGGYSDWGDRDGSSWRANRQQRRSSLASSIDRPLQPQRTRVTMNSINDIIDAYNRQQEADDLELPGDNPTEFTAAQLRLTRVHQRPRSSSTEGAASEQRQRVVYSAPNMEISLDELASIGRDTRQEQQQQVTRQDLSSLYYDRVTADSPQNDDYLGAGGRLMRNQPGQYRSARPTDDVRHDVLDDDEWRFDSIKSVTHAAPANKTSISLGGDAPAIETLNIGSTDGHHPKANSTSATTKTISTTKIKDNQDGR